MESYDLTDGQEPVSYAEIYYLKTLARKLPADPVIINIGAATGVSTCAFLEERPDCYIYSVDILPCEEELENVDKCGLDRKQVQRVLGNSRDIGPEFPVQADMIFIDGDHWNAGGDIEAWVMTGKVKPGGVIALHDYQKVCAPNNPGSVYEHVEAWSKANPQFFRMGKVERVVAYQAV